LWWYYFTDFCILLGILCYIQLIQNIIQTQSFVMNFWWDAFSHLRIQSEPVPNISANVLNIAACVMVVNENKKCYRFIDHSICIKWYLLYAYRCLNFSIWVSRYNSINGTYHPRRFRCCAPLKHNRDKKECNKSSFIIIWLWLLMDFCF
jgi:hypothetical protein